MTTLKQIDKAIASFTTNRDKLRQQAHEIALMIVRHAAPKEVSPDCLGSGDCTRALKLCDAMPKSWAVQMRSWFEQFTPIRVTSDKTGYALKYKNDTAENKISDRWWKLEQAAATPFWKAEKEPDVKIFDFKALVKMVEGLSGRIEKMVKEGKVAPEDVASARVMADTIGHLQFKRVKAPASNTNETAATEEQAAA